MFDIPDLPAPDGRRMLRQAQVTIHRLGSYRVSERLSSGAGAIDATYAFVAPDLARIKVEGGSTSVFVGDTRYLREGDGPWEVEHGAPSLSVPLFIWDQFRPWVDPRVVGSGRVDGRAAAILAFFGDSAGTPVWFRLWVAEGGLVLKAQMRAQGHFMDQRYGDFDVPIVITAPRGAA